MSDKLSNVRDCHISIVTAKKVGIPSAYKDGRPSTRIGQRGK